MTNPFSAAESVEPHAKVLAHGGPGVGKTFLGLSAPGKVAVIDTEGGTAFYAGRFDFDVLHTKSYADFMAAIDFLATGKHDYKTVLIDPVTVIYETLQEAAVTRRAEMNRKRGRGATTVDEADLEQLDWGRIKRSYKRAMTALVNLGMHVIVTAREKAETVRDQKGNFEQTGKFLPDAEKTTAYYFDVVLRLVDEGGKRVAIITKDRTGSHELDARVADPTFDSLFGKVLKSKGKGKRKVQDDDEAVARDVAAEEAALHPTAEQLAALEAALKEVGADTERMQREMQIEGWEELRPDQVERLTARALADIAASKNGKAEKVEAHA